jgi:uncharacterized membrane protein YeaQ/YmgE (transglycosylase-associated protein family)
VEILGFLLIGLVAGWLASHLIKVRGLGLAEKLIVGVIGAVIGGYIFRALPVDVPVGSGTVGSLITATVGAAILLFVLKLVRRY